MSKTSTERQRECRQRKRDTVTPQNVTDVTTGPDVDVTVDSVSNPVAIPGDADYVGCCKQVEGEWQVNNSKPSVHAMSVPVSQYPYPINMTGLIRPYSRSVRMSNHWNSTGQYRPMGPVCYQDLFYEMVLDGAQAHAIHRTRLVSPASTRTQAEGQARAIQGLSTRTRQGGG